MISTGQGRLVWTVMLALSPLAYLGSMLIERAMSGQADVAMVDEAQATRIALQFAESRQFHTQGWRPAVGASSDTDLVALYRTGRQAPFEGFVPASHIRVALEDPKSKQVIRVDLTPQGQVYGFRESRAGQPQEATVDAARTIAEAYLHERVPAASPLQWEYRPPSRDESDDQERSFTWRAPLPGLAKSTATFRVDMFGRRVIGERRSVSIDEAVVRQLRRGYGWVPVFKGFAEFYLFLMGIYALVRYIRRSRDKEVSHHRTLLAALVWVSISALLFFDSGYLTTFLGGDPEVGRDRVLILVILMIGMCVFGAFFGIAYGAGEGGLRESYAGKLTSLDALFSGKLVSANVARSVLTGGGIAGWMLLLRTALEWVFHGSRIGVENDVLTSAFMRFPLAALAVDRVGYAMAQNTFGLLLPIVFLRKGVHSRAYYPLLIFLSALSASVTAGNEASLPAFLGLLLALLAVLYLSFFGGDLLAGICGAFALLFVGALIQRSAISTTWEHIFLWDVAPAGIAFLAAEVWFAWRGRVYDDDEVRPRYARYLAEHIAMDAEIGAARLAQLRLLPAAPPRIGGLSIAGSCVPAREVGGDFFDFYDIGADRLGVFVAEGGSRELGSAMTIALAKGYLLYAAGLDLSPAEILRRLNEALGAALHTASMSVLYAVVDGRARTVRFARTGDSPRLLINGKAAVEDVAAPSDARAIRHGMATLCLHDVLFFYTDGLATQIAERKRQWTDRFVQKLLKQRPAWSAAELHRSIVGAAVRGKQHPPDDVTSVVVRVEEQTVQAVGVVA